MNTNKNIIFLSPESGSSMYDEWYEFATGNHFWMKWRFEALQEIIPNDYIWGRTLDVGCGTGIVRDQIEKHYDCTVSGCDLNRKALQMSAESSSPLYFYNVHQKNEEFREGFSTILLLDVLEHIQDPADFLDAVSFHLKKDGRLIINVPAIQSLYSAYDKVIGHVRRYNILSLNKELQLSGLHIEKTTYWGMSLIPLLMIRRFILRFCRKENIIEVGFQPASPLIDSLLQLIMRIEYAILPRPPLGTSLIVVARKDETQTS